MNNGVDKLLNIEEVASILKDDIKKIDGNKTAQLFRNSLNPIKFIKNLPDKFLPLLLYG